MSLAARWRIRRPGWVITCAAHSLNACARADAIGADAVFLAPVFATKSHPGRASIGPLRLRIMTHMLKVPIYALGGIDALSARRLDGAHLAGLAAIDALANSSAWNLQALSKGHKTEA
jgi:thiamine-phosphate pyrophosphorylase